MDKSIYCRNIIETSLKQKCISPNLQIQSNPFSKKIQKKYKPYIYM